MEAFPFSKTEWAAVREAALPVVNATLADDAVLRASHLAGLLDVLTGLRARHGDHPVLLETEADFIDGDEARAALYRRAIDIAVINGLPTLSIRLSLARLLLDADMNVAARMELLACAEEARAGDESDQATWSKMVEEAEQCLLSKTPHRP